MSEDKFSVHQFFANGDREDVAQDLSAREASELAKRLAHSVGGRLGTTQRIIIVDSEDFTAFEWKFGEGVVFPPYTGEDGVVIRLIRQHFGPPSPADGQYLTKYDPTIREDKTFTLEWTPDKTKALRFHSVIEAFACYRRPCPNIPYNSPGHVNRPLTAFTISIEDTRGPGIVEVTPDMTIV